MSLLVKSAHTGGYPLLTPIFLISVISASFSANAMEVENILENIIIEYNNNGNTIRASLLTTIILTKVTKRLNTGKFFIKAIKYKSVPGLSVLRGRKTNHDPEVVEKLKKEIAAFEKTLDL